MQVKDAMSNSPCFVRPETPLKEAAELMRDRDCGCLPVGEHDRLVGMLTDRDIVIRAIAEGLNTADAKAGDVMTKGIKYCFEDVPLEEAARLMKEHKIRRLAVLNRDKRLVGILSVTDFVTRGQEEQLAGITEGEVCRKAA